MRSYFSILKDAWFRKFHVLGGDSRDTQGAAWKLCIKFPFVLDAKETRQNLMGSIGRWMLQFHASSYPSVKYRHGYREIFCVSTRQISTRNLTFNLVINHFIFSRTLPRSNIFVLDGILSSEHWTRNTKRSMTHNGMIYITLIAFRFHTAYLLGTAVAQWLRCCATNRKVAGSIPAGVSGFFIDIKSFRSHYDSGVDSASTRSISWG